MRPAQLAARLGPKAPCMHAHLVRQARDAHARESARDAHRVQAVEQLDGAVLGAFGDRDARQGAIARAARFRAGRRARARRGGRRAAQRPRPRGHAPKPRRQAARRACEVKGLRRPRSASAPRERRPEQALGQQDLSLPEVAQPDDEVAPAADVAGDPAEVGARRLLLAQTGQRRLALETGAEGASGSRAPAAASARAAAARRPRDRAARRSGPGRRRTPLRRSGSARIRSAGRRRRRAGPGCARPAGWPPRGVR